MFLPASGYYSAGGEWNDGGNFGYSWSSKQDSENDAYSLYFASEDGGVDRYSKSDFYDSCRLVRE